MGRSTDGIPIELLNNPDKEAFINWLTPLPLTNSGKRAIIAAYREATQITFTAADYAFMMPRLEAP